MLMSEAAYLFFSLLALSLFDRWEAHQAERNERILGLAAAAAVCALATRTVGLSLVLAMLVFLLSKRKFRQVGIVAAVFVLGLLPQIWLNIQNGGSVVSTGYNSQVFGNGLATKLLQLISNIRAYTKGMILANILVPVFGPDILRVRVESGLA